MKKLLIVLIPVLFACSKAPEKAVMPLPKISVTEKSAWTLNPRQSMMTIDLVKDGQVPVTSTLNFAVGAADLLGVQKPVFEAALDLQSYNSDLLERDERVTKIFFAVTDESNRYLRLKIEDWSEDLKTFLKASESNLELTLAGEVTLAGKSLPISLNAKLAKTADKIRIESIEPTVVKISEFGLTPSLEALQDAYDAKIADEVKITLFAELNAPKSATPQP